MSAHDGPSIDALVRDVLVAHGPATQDELLEILAADGADLGPEPENTLGDVLDHDEHLFLPLTDDRWAWLPALLDGRVFTHRLTSVEADHDVVALGPDLAALSVLTECETYQKLTDGTGVAAVSPSFDTELLAARGLSTGDADPEGLLLLPPGRFSALGVAAGDLIGLRITATGFELAAAGKQPAPSEIGTLLVALLVQRSDRPEMLDTAVWTLCADNDGLFREPTTPLGDVLSANEIVREQDWVALNGFDFGAWRLDGQLEAIMEAHDLDEDEALTVIAIVELYEATLALVDAVATGPESEDGHKSVDSVSEHLPWAGPAGDEDERALDRATVAEVLELLAEPAVAIAVLTEADRGDDRANVALAVFCESVEPLAPPAARPALRWLQGNAYERLGDLEQAEANFLAAESLDASFPLALISLARYASDRGDAERGLSLLRRAGAPPDDEMVTLLEHFRPAPRRDLGRNHPCWCGSGRKYKVCHLHREQLPLAERAAWLYQKPVTGMLEGSFADVLVEAAAERCRYWDFSDAMDQAIEDPLVWDAALFEGGAFADFLAVRGALLPDDERQLAEQWLVAERSVHEVTSVRAGDGMTLRDVRTGAVHAVREAAASRQVSVGELYCARVVPAGDTVQVFGGMEPVAPRERDQVIAVLDSGPDPVELVAALSRRFAPVALQHIEDEPLLKWESPRPGAEGLGRS